MSTPYVWVESNSWELDFFGLPRRIPWPADVDPKKASEEPFDHAELVRAIELMGPDAGAPWTGFLAASEHFDALAEALEDNEFPQALALIEKVEHAHPGTAFAAFHRAVVARQDGRYEEAAAHYEAAARKTPNIGMIWFHLGTVLAQEGQRDKAVAALNHAVRCNPQDTNALEALASLKGAVKLLRDPKDPKSAIYVGIAQYRQLCEQQFKELRDNHAALIEFGEFQLRHELMPEIGVQAIERARELQPTDPRTLAALANAYRLTNKPEQAKAVAQELAERFPNEPQAWLNLAHVLDAIGDKEGEHIALEHLLELDPNAQAALVLLFGLNDGPAPEKEERLAAHAAERKAPFAYLLASSSARDRGDHVKALDYATRAYKLAPESEEVMLQYCAMLGNAKEILILPRDIEPAIESGKFSPRLAWNYAHALKQCGQLNEAINALVAAASAEGVPEDFQHAVTHTIDFWTGRLAQAEIPIALSQAGTIARPVLLSLEGEDGAVLFQAGQTLPAESRFPWRIRLDAGGETRIALQQGLTGGTIHPILLGSFVVKVPPITGGAHKIHCLLGTGGDGKLLFKAIQGAKELPVRWVAPGVV